MITLPQIVLTKYIRKYIWWKQRSEFHRGRYPTQPNLLWRMLRNLPNLRQKNTSRRSRSSGPEPGGSSCHGCHDATRRSPPTGEAAPTTPSGFWWKKTAATPERVLRHRAADRSGPTTRGHKQASGRPLLAVVQRSFLPVLEIGLRFVDQEADEHRRAVVARLKQLQFEPPPSGTTLDILRDLRS